MASSDYIILQGLPTPQRYHDLRKLAGLTPPPPEAIPEAVSKALQNSVACFVAYERKDMKDESAPGSGQDVVAMGRLVGDGALFLQLCDVAVHPDHQYKGLGKGIMESLVKFADEHAPHAYTSLVADPLGQRLYPKYGFEEVTPSVGMFRCLRTQSAEGRAFRKAKEERWAASLKSPAGSS